MLKTVVKAIINIILICLILNMSVFAMNNTIYSYAVEDEGLNLWTATVPESLETLEIPSEIGGVTVTSIDDNFFISQVDARFSEYGSVRAYMARTELMIHPLHQFALKTIIVPDSIQRVGGNMVKEFRKENSVVNLKIPDSAVITDVTSPNIYVYAPNLYSFYLDYGSDAPVDPLDKGLSDVGTPVALYVDGKYINGCVVYNGISYVPFYSGIIKNHARAAEDTEKDGDPYSIWYSSINRIDNMPNKVLMAMECKLKVPEKFLDEHSAYTTEENAKYEMTGKRIMFNARTDKITTIEIYRPVDETEATPLYTEEINGVGGGEVKIESVPVYTGYVPVRMVFEAAQRKVDWDGETNTVYVTTPEDGPLGTDT